MDTKWKILWIIVVLGLLAIYPVALHTSGTSKEITVKEKWVKYHREDAKYLFSDEENNVYSIEDSIWLIKFDASDRYAKITEGKRYLIKTYGWRIRILSSYSNAMGITEISN
ncbi:DUF1523 family protein [Candidatus Parcubacteria bacterium]|nr:DUF1523 family protein [Candidatus Parcubacteria bacterium]